MKLFLKSKIFLLLLPLFVLFGYAADPIEYYTNELRNFKLSVIDVYTYKEASKFDNHANSFVVLSSSFLSESEDRISVISNLNKYIFVCDSVYTSEFVTCTKSNIEQTVHTVSEKITLDSKNDKYLLRYIDSDIEAFYIPEELFVIPKYKTRLKDYFHEYNRSKTIDDYILRGDQLNIFDNNNKENLLSLVNLLIFPLYLGIIIAFSELFWRFINQLVHFENDALRNNGLYLFYKVFLILRWPFVLITFITLAFLKIKFQDSFVYGDFLLQIKEITNMLINTHRSFLYVLTLSLLFIFWLPTFMKMIYSGLERLNVFREKANTFILKKVFFVLLFAQLLLVSSKLILHIPVLYYVLLFFSIYLIFLFDNRVELKFSKKEKTALIFFTIIIIIIGNISSYFISKRPLSYKDLFNYGRDIVILPKIKRFDEYTKYTSFFLQSDVPLFVNDYLVYFPGVKYIKNLNISRFDASTNYVIVLPNNKEDIIETALRFDILIDLLQVETNTNYYYLDTTASDKTLHYEVYLDISCENIPSNNNIRFVVYSLSKRTIHEPLNFPGCNSNEDEFKFVAPLSLEDNNKLIVKIEGIDPDKLKGVLFYANGNPLKLTNIDMNIQPRVFAKAPMLTKDTVFSYSIAPKELEVSNTSVFNISDVLNYMITNDYIDKYFILWDTRAKHSILLNPF